jgi:hypothetical protein
LYAIKDRRIYFMETRPTGTRSDKELFVTVLGRLLRPLADDIVNEVITSEHAMTLEAKQENPNAPEVEMPMQDFVAEVHARILAKLYDLAQNDGMLSMALIPLMAHLKKMPNPVPSEVDLRDYDYEQKRRKGL